MTKLTLAFALLLTAAAAAHAQTTPAGTPYPPGTSPIEPRIIRDPVQRDEAHITASRSYSAAAESEADAARRSMLPNFKAVVEVTNHAAKAIKSVSWTATLTDPDTGTVVRTYDVTTKTDIAPGKTKKLSKRLRTPRANVVRITSRPRYKRSVADLKVAVTGVTYVDGSTSTTP
jgi:hypothetical protein